MDGPIEEIIKQMQAMLRVQSDQGDRITTLELNAIRSEAIAVAALQFVSVLIRRLAGERVLDEDALSHFRNAFADLLAAMPAGYHHREMLERLSRQYDAKPQQQ